MLSVTIVSLNEEAHISEALDSASWAAERIVVDCGSTDRTVEIAKAKGARVIHNAWPGYGQQKNFAQAQATQPWVLNIDADERIGPELRAEIEQAIQSSRYAGYRIPRKTLFMNRWIRHGGWYPNYLTRLARRDRSRWTEPEIHEELRVDGDVGTLAAPLIHYTFDGIEDQVSTNLRYSAAGSRALRAKGKGPSVALLVFKPIGKFLETYVLKRGFLDGLPGFIISVNAAHSMFLKQAYLFEEAPKRS